jgi:malate/lactate dehydrogenase
MPEIAVLGAGDLGGAVTHMLARSGAWRAIRLIDETGQVAEGKALDIRQAAASEGFAAAVDGRPDVPSAAGARVIVLADRASGGEWAGEEGLQLLARVARLAPGSLVVCACPTHRVLVERAVRELRFSRECVFGSAPEALAGAARALVAVEADTSPRDVGMSVLGVPPHHIVVPWEDVTINGFAATRLLGEPARHRLASRIRAAWPPGPVALAAAAVKAVGALTGRSHHAVSLFAAPDDSTGVRARAAALPVRLGASGIARIEVPALIERDRVALENAMLL